MKSFEGRTAVITGAASGFGLEVARIAARKGMNIVMADVQQDALDEVAVDPWLVAVAGLDDLG